MSSEYPLHLTPEELEEVLRGKGLKVPAGNETFSVKDFSKPTTGESETSVSKTSHSSKKS